MNQSKTATTGFRRPGIERSENAAFTPDAKGTRRRVVHPCVLNGKPTIFHAQDLAQREPALLRRLRQVAYQYGICVREERRRIDPSKATGLHGKTRDDRRKNNLTMMTLGVCLAGTIAATAHADVSRNSALPVPFASQTNFQRSHDVDHRALMLEMLAWLHKEGVVSGEHASPIAEPPNLLIVPQTEMLQVAFGDRLPASSEKGGLKIYGLYNFKNETIYLLDEIDLSSPQGRGTLVHELVHYLQYEHGENHRVKCKNELEPDAYALEAKYLSREKKRAKFNHHQISRLSRCN